MSKIVSQSTNQSTNQLANQSTNQSINQAIKQSIKQSIRQSIRQSIKNSNKINSKPVTLIKKNNKLGRQKKNKLIINPNIEYNEYSVDKTESNNTQNNYQSDNDSENSQFDENNDEYDENTHQHNKCIPKLLNITNDRNLTSMRSNRDPQINIVNNSSYAPYNLKSVGQYYNCLNDNYNLL